MALTYAHTHALINFTLCHSQCHNAERPYAELRGQQVFARGLGSALRTLGEEFPVPRHEVPVAVDDLPSVVDRAAEARALAHVEHC